MSQIHKVQCDICHRIDNLIFNGCHFLEPAGWFKLFDNNKASVTEDNLCNFCYDRVFKKVNIEKDFI